MTRPIALITGATGGVGTAITARLLREGYTVIATARDPEKLRTLREADLEHILPLVLDACSVQSAWMTTLVSMFDYHGIEPRIDALICAHGYNAVVTTPTVALSMTEEFIPIVLTDLGGCFCAAQAVAPYMIRQQAGSIVFISSLHAHQTYPARAAYAAAKAGIGGMARSLALEWGAQGITVNTILPWQIAGTRTFLQAHHHEQATGEDLLRQYQARSPLRHLVSERDVADAALFLLRNRSCTGMELVLDTGVSASMWYKEY